MRNLKAAILGRTGDFERFDLALQGRAGRLPAAAQGVDEPRACAEDRGTKPRASIEAYRRCIELAPQFGEVWWSLANLKTFRFTAAEIALMRAQLERADLTNDDRFHFHFSLGKALEDDGEYAESFDHYAQGNALRRKLISYDADDNAAHVARSRKLFTREFFADARRLGMRSAGSDLRRRTAALRLHAHRADPGVAFAGRRHAGAARHHDDRARRRQAHDARGGLRVSARAREILRGRDCARSARNTSTQTRIQRKTAAPFFIDKMPNNFAHVGLIHLILPNAKIIDARRHPMGCCFSCFKQHFARGQNFTYELGEIGRYYRDYVELMAHFDAVLPGRVHRVFYENMVEDTEGEVRRLLAYLRAAVRGIRASFSRKPAGGAHRELRASAPAHLSGKASISGGTTSRTWPPRGSARPGPRRYPAPPQC